MGQMLELGGVVAHRRDVGIDADIVQRLAAIVAHRADGQPLRHRLAVGAADPHAALPVVAILQRRQDPGEGGGRAGDGIEHRQGLAAHRSLGMAGDGAEGRIDRQDRALRVGHHQPLQRGVEHRLGLLLALGRQDPVGDVAMGADHAFRMALLVAQDHGAGLDMAIAAVPMRQPVFGFEAVSVTAQRRAQRGDGAQAVLGMQKAQPGQGADRDLVGGVSQHRGPGRRDVKPLFLGCPVDQPVIGPLHRQLEALFALAQGMFDRAQAIGRFGLLFDEAATDQPAGQQGDRHHHQEDRLDRGDRLEIGRLDQQRLQGHHHRRQQQHHAGRGGQHPAVEPITGR